MAYLCVSRIVRYSRSSHHQRRAAGKDLRMWASEWVSEWVNYRVVGFDAHLMWVGEIGMRLKRPVCVILFVNHYVLSPTHAPLIDRRSQANWAAHLLTYWPTCTIGSAAVSGGDLSIYLSACPDDDNRQRCSTERNRTVSCVCIWEGVDLLRI